MVGHVDIIDGLSTNLGGPKARMAVNQDGSINTKLVSALIDSLGNLSTYSVQAQEQTQLLRAVLAELRNVSVLLGGQPVTDEST